MFVRTPTGYERRPVTLGLYNEKMIEVRDGLAVDDEVVLNPKVLLGDSKAKTRDGEDKAGGKGGKSGDKAGGKGGGGGNKGSGGGKGGKGPPQ